MTSSNTWLQWASNMCFMMHFLVSVSANVLCFRLMFFQNFLVAIQKSPEEVLSHLSMIHSQFDFIDNAKSYHPWDVDFFCYDIFFSSKHTCLNYLKILWDFVEDFQLYHLIIIIVSKSLTVKTLRKSVSHIVYSMHFLIVAWHCHVPRHLLIHVHG